MLIHKVDVEIFHRMIEKFHLTVAQEENSLWFILWRPWMSSGDHEWKQNFMVINSIVAEMDQPPNLAILRPMPLALLKLHCVLNVKNCMFKLLKRNVFCSKYPPSILGTKMKGLVFQQSGGSLSRFMSTEELPCLSKFSPGPLWRLEQVEVTGALACTHGTDGWTPWPKPQTSESTYR